MRDHWTGRIALVSGATRGGGRGIAVALGEAGATVYATGRSTRERRSEIDRPETIEETAELVTAAGGEGIAVEVDHLDPAQVGGLVERIDSEHGRLDVLVNDIWGSEHLFEWKKSLWEHDLDNGLRLLRLAIDTHLITSHHALPLLVRNPGGLVVEVTDGTAAYNADHYRVNMFYDLAKTSVIRMAWGLGQELAPHGCTAVALTPGWMRSELMLEHHSVSESNWRDATERTPHFCISETPAVRGPSGRRACRRSRRVALERPVALQRPARAGLRLHRPRRNPARLLALHGRGGGARGRARRRQRLPLAAPGCGRASSRPRLR